MFRELKNKMLVLNLSIFTILLLAVFTILYMTTYTNLRTRTEDDLDRMMNINVFRDDLPTEPLKPGGINSFTLSFSVLVRSDEVIDTFSEFNIDEDIYVDAYDLVDSTSGKITIEEYTFMYKSTTTGDLTMYSFSDITRDQELLNTSLTRYIVIFVVTLGVTAVITNYITNRSIKPVKESYEKQKEFVANASHELKTPLTVINTNIDVLLSSKTYKDNKWLHYIKNESNRMNKLTQDLLYLAKTGENQSILKTTFNASNDVESLLLGLEALAYEKNITLDYNIEENCMIKFNQEQFTQVIMILLDNAIKYTPEKGTITLNLAKQNKQTIISIRNSGEGIKQEDIDNLFERFYKVDKSRQNKSESNSFGLGLSIAKAILDNHKAVIKVTSELEEYTQFKVIV